MHYKIVWIMNKLTWPNTIYLYICLLVYSFLFICLWPDMFCEIHSYLSAWGYIQQHHMLDLKTCSSWSKCLIITGRSCNDCVKVVLVTWRGLVCFKSTVIIQTKARPNCPVKQSSCHWAAADLFSGQGWSIFAVSGGQKEGSDRLSPDI